MDCKHGQQHKYETTLMGYNKDVLRLFYLVCKHVFNLDDLLSVGVALYNYDLLILKNINNEW